MLLGRMMVVEVVLWGTVPGVGVCGVGGGGGWMGRRCCVHGRDGRTPLAAWCSEGKRGGGGGDIFEGMKENEGKEGKDGRE